MIHINLYSLGYFFENIFEMIDLHLMVQIKFKCNIMVRQFLLGLFSLIFALFILVYQYLNQIVFIACRAIKVLTHTQRHISSISHALSLEGNSAISQYIQIIANSSISLMSAYSILHFHQHFLKVILVISHHVHLWFIRRVVDIGDYSHYLEESYQFRVGVCYLYLFVGYLGISSQIVLTVDLIYLSNLPTIIIYKLLAKVYQLLIKYFKILMDLITIKKESWLSCPYHEIFLRDSFKVFYIGLVPILGYAIVIVVFYYLWLAIVITALKIVMNMSLNVGAALDQLGFVLCLIKGINIQSKNSQRQKGGKLLSKIDLLRARIKQIDWITLFQFKIFLEIIKGNDLFGQQASIPPTIKIHSSFSRVFKAFQKLR